MTTLERSYEGVVDRTNWGDGPWNGEPDKVQWVDEATGYDCLAVRGPGGHWCGYVGLPPEHPCHGVDYDNVRVPRRDPDDEWSDWPEVHGGLTFADSCDEGKPEDRGICHVPLDGRPDKVWWLGFDCAHCGDVSPRYAANDRARGWGPIDPRETYKTLDYVRQETTALAAQLVNATPASPRED